jgi:hypothetical protein
MATSSTESNFEITYPGDSKELTIKSVAWKGKDGNH